jgi:hypothetical protein
VCRHSPTVGQRFVLGLLRKLFAALGFLHFERLLVGRPRCADNSERGMAGV